MSYNWVIYKELNQDLVKCGLQTKQQYDRHYMMYGKLEGRKCNILALYPYFNHEIYRNNYAELSGMNDEQLELHWLQYGVKEGRDCSFKKNNQIIYKKISIVMAYFNDRKTQIINTLDGFNDNYYGKYNFEVIIVDDNSKDEDRLDDNITKYNYPIKYRYITKTEKGNRTNPCAAYNIGFKLADGDLIIIQNPECYHVGDILGHAMKFLNDTNYLAYSCFNTGSIDLTNELLEDTDKINNNEFIIKNKNKTNLPWYNHPIYRPVNYHFCSAITKCNLDKLGGFDEEYANGYWYDDDDFLLEIQYKIKLNVKTVPPTNNFVIHQYHVATHNKDELLIQQKINKNAMLFKQKKKLLCVD